jgi:hypothetical protein
MIYAQTVEFRFKIPEISQNTPLSQSLLINKGINTFGSESIQFGVVLEYTGSLASGSYSGSILDPYYQHGNLKFILPEISSSASVYLPFFNNNWWSVAITKTEDFDNQVLVYNLYAASKTLDEYGQYVIQYQNSSSLTCLTDWRFTGSVQLPGSGSSTILGKIYVPATGSFQELRYYNISLSESQFNDYVVNSNSIEGNTLDSSYDELFFRAALGGELFTGSTSIHPSVAETSSFLSGNSNFGYTGSYSFISNTEVRYYDQVPSGIKNAVSQKVQQQNIVLPYSSSKNNIPNSNVLSPFISVQQSPSISQSYTRDIDYVEVGFSPQNEINDDINDQLGYFNIGEFIGDPRQVSSSANSYPDLDGLRDSYFKKYSKDYQEWDYIRLIQFFDNSLFKTVADWVPARTSLASGIIIKQHLLERNKYPVPQAEISTSIANVASGSTNIPFYQENILFTGSIPMGTITGSDGGTLPNMNGQTSSVILPGNYNTNVTQVWSGSNSGPLGIVPFTDSYQTEFFDGELSGSTITVTTQSLNPDNILLNNLAFYPTIADYQDLDVISNTSLSASGATDIIIVPFNNLQRSINYYNTSTYQYNPTFNTVADISIFITASVAGTSSASKFIFIGLYENGTNLITPITSEEILFYIPSSTPTPFLQQVSQSFTFNNIPFKSGSSYGIYMQNTSGVSITSSYNLASNWTVTTVNPQTIGYPNDPNIYQQSTFPGNLELYPEYNAVLNNVYSSRLSDKYFDVDYSQQNILPVNQQVILSQSAVYAQVQDSNYTLASNINPRYVGSKNTSAKYNTYTVGDLSYGKKAAIDNHVNYFAYWDWIGGSNPQYPGGGNIHLTYLIDTEGNAIPLTGDNTWLETVSNIFVKNQTANILPAVVSTGNNNPVVTIVEGGAIMDTVVFRSGSVSSNFITGYVSGSVTSGIIIYQTSSFSQSSTNLLTDSGSISRNSMGWLYPFLTTSSIVSGTLNPEVSFLYDQFSSSIKITNKSTLSSYGIADGTENDVYVPYSNTYLPIQKYDYIRFGNTSNRDMDTTFEGQGLVQITDIFVGDDIRTSSSLFVTSIDFTLTTNPLEQNWRIFRRVPKDNFVLIQNIPSYRDGGFLIPENFNPNFDPYTLARKAGLIQ